MQEARLREGTFPIDSLVQLCVRSRFTNSKRLPIRIRKDARATGNDQTRDRMCFTFSLEPPSSFELPNVNMANYEIGLQRIRGPFDSAPYSAAIHSCERFLEHIVEVRQSSLFFQPFLFGGKHLISHAYLASSIYPLETRFLSSKY